MNRNDLLAKFETAGISPAAYSIDGVSRNETYVLSRGEKDCWIVYYSERGLMTALAQFATESDACAELLSRVLDDPSTRAR